MRNLFKLILIMAILLPLVSSTGLRVEPTSISLNKTNGVESTFNFTVYNDEPFTFYNVTSDNPIVAFTPFNLDSGQNRVVQARIIQNQNFNGVINIRGDFFSNLGASNETYQVTIDSNGVDLCNLDLIEGDSISWQNTLLGEVRLKNGNTNQYFATLAASSTHTQTFEDPTAFDYQVFRVGLPFSNICNIDVRPTQGYVHDRDYDAPITLLVALQYLPTTIQATFITTSYNLTYNGEFSDVFTMRNTGSQIARGIHLSGDWFNFAQNDFDLGIGQSINIGYVVDPIIFETNQTNKTHDKSIIITGNFETVTRPIQVYIQFQEISTFINNNSFNKETLREWVSFFCNTFPDECPQTVANQDPGSNNVTFNINEETYREKILADSQFQENTLQNQKQQNERLTSLEGGLLNITDQDLQTRSSIERTGDTVQEFLGRVMAIVILVIVGLVIAVIAFILINDRARIRVRGLFKKGEHHW